MVDNSTQISLFIMPDESRQLNTKLFNSQFVGFLRKSDAVRDASERANIANIRLAAVHPSSKATDASSGSPRQLLSVQ